MSSPYLSVPESMSIACIRSPLLSQMLPPHQINQGIRVTGALTPFLLFFFPHGDRRQGSYKVSLQQGAEEVRLHAMINTSGRKSFERHGKLPDAPLRYSGENSTFLNYNLRFIG